jgi:ABC-type multidrug transport system ATPase subunit/pSer/pThr/pTyr-binding forkhead associated (FHA) protein
MATNQPRKLVFKQGPRAGEAFLLEQAELIIGREPGVTLQIDSPGVSRRHARLFLQAGQYLLEDLNSSNGTFLNEERLAGSRRLKSGDVIRLGQSVALEYQVELPTSDATMLEGTAPQAGATVIEGVSLPPGGATMIGEEPFVGRSVQPPQLLVAVAGGAQQTYSLTQARLNLGRADDNQIVINSQIVSRHHAYLERTSTGYQLVVLPEAGNPVLLDGRSLETPRQLKHGDILRIGSQDPGLMVSMTYLNPQGAAESAPRPIQFGEKPLIQIGRDASNDVVLESPNISRFHAQVERVGQRFRIRDLRSANGTFVNDQRVEGEVWLQPNDEIRIGRHRFVMGENALSQVEATRGLDVDAVGLNKWVRKDLNILQNISLAFKPREFIVVVGQSGGGKSTLVDAIAGYRPATHGVVMVNGTNVYKHFDAVRNDIGYVPQKDIIHTELTVYQALDYAAKLRMPRDATKADRHARIMQVLEDLDLVHRKDNPIHKLSGGQIKRVSIGVELLTEPGLFFLDEPTSGLDPGTETAFMHLMRRLADQGRTIVMITHATKNVMLADKVVFLARGGYLTWFGPPEEALEYFDQYRSERERRAREMDFDQIYAILDDPQQGSAEEWAKRYMEHPAYQKYIVQPLQATQAEAAAVRLGQPEAKPAAPRPKRKSHASGLHQFFVLSARNLKILLRDRTSLILMLVAPLLIAALDFVIAPLMGRNLYDYNVGDPSNGAITLFLLTVYSLLVGGFSQMREFVKEADVYKRERLVNLKIVPYVFSKVWVALLLAFYQAAAFAIIHYVAFDMPGTVLDFGLFYFTLVLAVMAGMMAGLLASAFAPNASSAPLLMILLIVPQIVLSGALAPVPENISAVASTRWAFESFIGITGMGSDVAADPCWQLTEELRDAMTLEDKAANGCNCMGAAVFTPGSCNFPGIGQYYKPEVDQPPPVEPEPLGEKPPEPEIPPAPEPPADQGDQVAMVQYLNALQAYQDDVALIQDQYRSEIELYEAQADVFKAQMEDYQEARLEYESARSTAINSAESVIESVRDEFGWAYVDKNDDEIFWPWMLGTWGAQLVLIGVYIVLILVLIKRKDV